MLFRKMDPHTKKEKKEAIESEELKEKRYILTEFFQKPFFYSRTFANLLFIFILGLALIGGLLFLSSDPPRISWSQDVGTDPPQYTYFARNKVLWNEWNSFDDKRLPFFLKSFTTLFSYLVFSIFGVGRFQANLVAVILNILTLFLFFFALKKIFTQRMALLSLFFLGTNFLFIMYGRNPFLEISAIFLLVLGFYFVTSSFKRDLFLIPAGICFASAIFFGKVMAIFILLSCLGVLILWMLEDFSSQNRKINLRPTVYFAAGFALVSVFWLFFSYLPAKKEVAGYIGEQALGLYGFPEALKSVSVFLGALFTFGTELFYRMPIVFLLSFLGLLFYFWKTSTPRQIVQNKGASSRVQFFLVLWLLGSFFLAMILNYRPLRYQLYLIPPMCALAGWWLDSFLRFSDFESGSSHGILFWIFWVVALTFFIHYSIITFYISREKTILMSWSVSISFGITLLLGSLYYWLGVKSRKVVKNNSPGLNFGRRFLITLILVMVSLSVDTWQYLSWASYPRYSLKKASIELGKILSPEAVVSGPYGPGLVWNNKLKDVIHMFTVKPDSLLFSQFPITHLALERNGNRERAFQDYPQVMNHARIVATYFLRNIPVDIYRIAEWTGNPQAQNYPPSDFEKARMLIDAGERYSALVLMEDLIPRIPENFSVYQAVAEIYADLTEYELSALCLEQAISFNPTDFMLHQQLGWVYRELKNKTGDDSYKVKAIREWEKSIGLFPQNSELGEELEELRGY